MTFTGRARVTRADAISDLFSLSGRALYMISKPEKLSRSAKQLSVDSTPIKLFNLLKPTGYAMHHQFNIQQLYILPTLYLCVLCLSENKR
jgi:hypothetical protein